MWTLTHFQLLFRPEVCTGIVVMCAFESVFIVFFLLETLLK